jgi:hypothetical protein
MMATLRQVADGIAEIAARHPDAEVIRNDVGNVCFLTQTGELWGYVNVRTGEWAYFDLDGTTT